VRMRAGVVVVVSILALAVLPGATAPAAPGQGVSARAGLACGQWQSRTLLSGQGWLEDLEFDRRGAITISALVQGRILRLSRHGRLSTLVASVNAPGGERTRGHYLYFNTGDTVPLMANGTIDRLDLRTGKHSTWTRDLTMPNALIFLPSGDAVVSGEVPSSIGLTRVPAHDPAHPQFGWALLDGTNGLALDPSGRWLYTDRTLSSDGEVDRVLISNPRIVQVVGRLGPGVFPDDMSIDERGRLYIAGFVSGKIYRLDPYTHASCAIASGLVNPTAARFGGRGWHARDLYVTDAGGHLSELTPP
jgi:hypothetical protein